VFIQQGAEEDCAEGKIGKENKDYYSKPTKNQSEVKKM
jgi:hypothetical protein